MRILVAEDDAPLADAFREQLSREQFAVQTVSDGTEAQRLAADQCYDAVILDLDLCEGSSLELLRNIRSRKPDLPVLVTGSSVIEELVRGLDAGADDYVVKPFAFAELAARIRAVLRRGCRARASVLTVADLTMDVLSRTVNRGGRTIDLSPREFSLLEFLLRHAGLPVTRMAIIENVWKLNHETMTNVVDVYINYLRRKIDNGSDSALIRTVRGVGYQIGGTGLPAQ
jgi:two-component system, OmpR family, copper resistance phosphate regulon response regulator CusR